MIDAHSLFLLASAVAAVAALIALIAALRVNPFIALLVTSLGLALAVRMPAATIVKSFETGVGNTLGHIAIVVGLGTMLGKMLAESGGADAHRGIWREASALGHDARRVDRRAPRFL